MLRAGGTKRHKELLAPFGLDASDPAFWKKGLDVIAGFIDELEQAGANRRRRTADLGSDAPQYAMSDRSNLFGEIRRMARTSGAVGGIAARVAGARMFGIKTDRAAHAEDLRTILGGLKGPLMKVAQFLSTVPDALPAEYAEELAQLQANAPPMGWNFVRRRMASELGTGWEAEVRRASAMKLPRRRAWARCIAPRCTTAPMSHASCNIRTCRARSKPICGSFAWRWRSITAWTTPSSTRRSTRSSPNACARNSTTSARPRRCVCIG